MKQLVILFVCLDLISACGNSGASTDEQAVNPSNLLSEELSALPPAEAQDDSSAVDPDVVSGATNVANAASFNGIFVVPPQNRVTVTLTMGGVVKETSLIVGGYVKRGEVIAKLHNPDFIELQQNALEAQAQFDFLKEEYERQDRLVNKDAASKKRFQQSKAEYLSAKSRFEALCAQLSLLGVEYEQIASSGMKREMLITAPISGYVTNTSLNIGKYLEAGQPLCDIIDKSSLLIQLTAYEKDLPKLHVGAEVEFTVNGMPGKSFEAKIISVDQKVDAENRSVKVFARLKEHNSQFIPGMYLSAKVKSSTN